MSAVAILKPSLTAKSSVVRMKVVAGSVQVVAVEGSGV